MPLMKRVAKPRVEGTVGEAFCSIFYASETRGEYVLEQFGKSVSHFLVQGIIFLKAIMANNL